MISDKSSSLLNRLISIFKPNRYIHRVVTLHGDTAGSSGVFSRLPPSGKNKHHPEVRICGYLFVLSFIAGLLNYFLMTLHFNNFSQVIEMEIL